MFENLSTDELNAMIEAAKVEKARRESQPVHTLRNGSTMFHAMDCPGCQNTPFTLSPRSETYWCS